MYSTFVISLVVLCALLVSGCKESSQSSGNSANGTSITGTNGDTINEGSNQSSRTAPGMQVKLKRMSLLLGVSDTLQVTIVVDQGQPEPLRVAAWIDDAYVDDASATTAEVADHGIWNVTVPRPSPLPAHASYLVRITLSDGNVIELGLDDFPVELPHQAM